MLSKYKEGATAKGFSFKDAKGKSCSIQESNLSKQPRISFGIDLLSLEGMNLRMQLTQNQVNELLPALTNFAETGKL